MRSTRALIVDDEPLARNALESVLRQRNDVECVDSAADAFEALNLLQNGLTMCFCSISECRNFPASSWSIG